MIKYRCYPCNKYFLKSELKKRKEDKKHIDYVCPDCEKVIICMTFKRWEYDNWKYNINRKYNQYNIDDNIYLYSFKTK